MEHFAVGVAPQLSSLPVIQVYREHGATTRAALFNRCGPWRPCTICSWNVPQLVKLCSGCVPCGRSWPPRLAPPCLPHVILADDASAWAPPQRLVSLWGLLRLTMLKRIWIARCELVENGNSASAGSAQGIVCAFVREIRGLMQQDWLRVEGDVRHLSGVCPSWFRGRDPSLPLPRFTSWWCVEEVLASIQPGVGGSSPRLLLKLSRLSVPGMPM